MRNVLFLNHKEKQCGVYQYGKRTADILKKSERYNFIYCEVDSKDDFFYYAFWNNPIAIFYNYHPSTMSWLSDELTDMYSQVVHCGLYHEGSNPYGIKFDAYVAVDSTYCDSATMFSVPRPLFENIHFDKLKSDVPVISSFGFGFGNKGFGRVVKAVNDEFDEAIIRLHIPRAFYGDRNGELSENVFIGCQKEMVKPNIKLEITTDFKSDDELLKFLSESTINVFLYDEMMGRGLSSVIDYALSVKVPIAISKTDMFRHIYNVSPSICIEDRGLSAIIESGDVLGAHRLKWSNKNLIEKYETIISANMKETK